MFEVKYTNNYAKYFLLICTLLYSLNYTAVLVSYSNYFFNYRINLEFLNKFFLFFLIILAFCSLSLKKFINNYTKKTLEFFIFCISIETFHIISGGKLDYIFLEIVFIFSIIVLILNNFDSYKYNKNHFINIIHLAFILHSLLIFIAYTNKIVLYQKEAYTYYTIFFYNLILLSNIIFFLERKDFNKNLILNIFLFLINSFILQHFLTSTLTITFIFILIFFLIFIFTKFFLNKSFFFLNKKDIIFILILLICFSFFFYKYVFNFSLSELEYLFNLSKIDNENKNKYYLAYDDPDLSPIIRYNLVLNSLEFFLMSPENSLFGYGGYVARNNFRILGISEHVIHLLILNSYGFIGFVLFIRIFIQLVSSLKINDKILFLITFAILGIGTYKIYCTYALVVLISSQRNILNFKNKLNYD
jgi:hypothetical protein